MKEAFLTVEMFVLCGWRFSNQFDIVSETNAVGRELWLAIHCSLLCLETDRNIRTGKQSYMCLVYTHSAILVF